MSIRFFSAVIAAPGTPQRLTDSMVPTQATVSGALSGTVGTRAHMVILQAPHSNTAGKYIYYGGPLMSVSAKTGIGGELAPGAATEELYGIDSTFDLSEILIDTDSSATTERVYVTVID